MLSRISRRIATVNGDENAVPTDFKTSTSENSTKTLKRGLEQVCSNDSPSDVEAGEADPPPNKIARFELNVQLNNT